MNIFVLDLDHTINAQYHVNDHVVKMPTEAAQMLSVVVREVTGEDIGFKPTHPNHPCTRWARKSLSNWLWMRDYAFALEEEWKYRYGHPSSRMHKSCEVARSLPIPKIPDLGLTPFAQAINEVCYKPDAVAAYRSFYKNFKSHLANWGKRGEPDWWKTEELVKTC